MATFLTVTIGKIIFFAVNIFYLKLMKAAHLWANKKYLGFFKYPSKIAQKVPPYYDGLYIL